MNGFSCIIGKEKPEPVRISAQARGEIPAAQVENTPASIVSTGVLTRRSCP